MAYNKVVVNNEVIIDLTTDTVAADNLLEGEVAHDNSGTSIIGAISKKTKDDLILTEGQLIIPTGYYSEEISHIHYGKWLWDPFNFTTDIVLGSHIDV